MLTKQQRLQTYIKVLELLTNNKPPSYYWLCTHLTKTAFKEGFTNGVFIKIADTTEAFPELGTQKPVNSSSFVWWDRNDKLSRIRALENCIKLCNEKTIIDSD